VTESGLADEARRLVAEDRLAAAVFIPEGFSASLLPDPASGKTGPAAPVEVYANPARPLSASTVQSVTAEVVNQIEAGPVSGQVAIAGLLETGRLSLQDVPEYAAGLAPRLAADEPASAGIILETGPESEPKQEQGGSYLGYLAPGMAVFFLMYTVTYGGRSLLAERDGGTLPRLLATPTASAMVLGGKVLSIFTTGALQVGLLVLASNLLFRLSWGDPLGVAALVLAVSAAATGWGILLASFARTPYQVSSMGTAMMLFFGLLGGTFIPLANFSPLVRTLSKLTPNAWALEGFSRLNTGMGLAEIGGHIGALLLMAAVLFGLAMLFARRRWAAGFLS
jgi:ABC-2 type transport system permease protein